MVCMYEVPQHDLCTCSLHEKWGQSGQSVGYTICHPKTSDILWLSFLCVPRRGLLLQVSLKLFPSLRKLCLYVCVCVCVCALGENLAFWEAAEELKLGTASSMSTKAESIFK